MEYDTTEKVVMKKLRAIQKFDSLTKPWQEEDEDLDHLVMIAFGVHNMLT